MKKLILLIVLLITLANCNSIKNNSAYTITKIQSEKDGQTLFLKNFKNEEFRTVISIANGNFIKVNEGDKVNIEIKEVLTKTNPPVIISRKVWVIEK